MRVLRGDVLHGVSPRDVCSELPLNVNLSLSGSVDAFLSTVSSTLGLLRSWLSLVLPSPWLDDVVLLTSILGVYFIALYSTSDILSFLLQRRSERKHIQVGKGNGITEGKWERACVG